MSPCFATTTHCRLDRLTSQARYVRGHVSRRARHASGDSPWHSSAKHHILEACFFRMTPFRSMLLTVQSGLHSLAPRAQSVPAYAQVLRHSSLALSRRTPISWCRCESLPIVLIFPCVVFIVTHSLTRPDEMEMTHGQCCQIDTPKPHTHRRLPR